MLRQHDLVPFDPRSSHVPLAVDLELLRLDLVGQVGQVHPRTLVRPRTCTSRVTSSTCSASSRDAHLVLHVPVTMSIQSPVSCVKVKYFKRNIFVCFGLNISTPLATKPCKTCFRHVCNYITSNKHFIHCQAVAFCGVKQSLYNRAYGARNRGWRRVTSR